MKRQLFVSLIVALGLLVIGGPVRAEEASATEVAEDSGEAVLCGHCRTVWVRDRVKHGKIRVFRTGKSMACDECSTAMESWLAGGEAKHTCTVCGDLKACEAMQEAADAAPAESPESESEISAMCDKCETVWVRKPHRIKKTVVYRTKGKMDCPDCKSAVGAVLSGEVQEQKCQTCGGELARCTPGA